MKPFNVGSNASNEQEIHWWLSFCCSSELPTDPASPAVAVAVGLCSEGLVTCCAMALLSTLRGKEDVFRSPYCTMSE